MVELKALDKLTTQELEAIENHSPAFKKYRRILSESQNITELYKRRLTAWCECTAATVLNSASPLDVCRYWSYATDQILIESWKSYGLHQEGLSLFALGKLGSEELNLSSDIDLLIVSERPVGIEAELKAKNWLRQLSQATENGFLYRVDMDLRPGGRFANLIPSTNLLTDYYWGQGETWERLALIRLRPIIAQDHVKQEVLELRKAFSYRKYLDYSILEDLKILRQSLFDNINEKKGFKNIKLCPGGIRDIELLIHSQQVIHGGRNASLQTNRTNEAMQSLFTNELLDKNNFESIESIYWQLRQTENLLQCKEDRQTYLIDKKSELPNFDITKDIIGSLIGDPLPVKKLPETYEAQISWLESLGLDAQKAEDAWQKIIKALSFRQSRTNLNAYKEAVIYDFMKHISKGINPLLGINYLADFIYASRAKSSLFTVLAQSPNLVSDLSKLFTSSSYASQIVTSRPELIDSLFLQQSAVVGEDLQEKLENLLDQKFISQVSLGLRFLNSNEVQALTYDLSVLADKIIHELSEEIKKQFPSSLNILKLGKWGRLEASFKSDLDFVLVGDATLSEQDAKFSKRLISRMTEAHRGGSLYGIDLRLRPNGEAGPLVVTRDNLLSFIKDKADAWQRQSYYITRSADQDLQEQMRKSIVEKSFSDSDLVELLRIREMLWKKAGQNDIKYSKGGLVDIEFAVQIRLIMDGLYADSTPEGLELLFPNETNLIKNYFFLRRHELLSQFVLNQSISAVKESSWVSANMHKIYAKNWQSFHADLNQRLDQNYRILKGLDPVLSQA